MSWGILSLGACCIFKLYGRVELLINLIDVYIDFLNAAMLLFGYYGRWEMAREIINGGRWRFLGIKHVCLWYETSKRNLQEFLSQFSGFK